MLKIKYRTKDNRFGCITFNYANLEYNQKRKLKKRLLNSKDVDIEYIGYDNDYELNQLLDNIVKTTPTAQIVKNEL